MSWLAKLRTWLAAWRAVKAAIAAVLAALGKSAPEKPGEKVHGAHDPSKPVSDDDRLKSENNPAG